jgi:hypothetical protein
MVFFIPKQPNIFAPVFRNVKLAFLCSLHHNVFPPLFLRKIAAAKQIICLRVGYS